MEYWFGKRIKAKKHVSAANAHVLMAKGWVPTVFAGFGSSVSSVTLVRL